MIKNLKIEKLIIERIDEFDDEFYDEFGDYRYEPISNDRYDEEDVDEDDEEDYLCYLIRSMFSNYDIEALVERKDLDITINVFLQRKEKMANILKIFDIIYKMRKDILPEYYSQIELFETRMGEPVLCFEFKNELEGKKDGLPF
jgi:hypothetical protein